MKTFIVSAMVLVGLITYTWQHWTVTTDLEYFLPRGQSTVDADVLRGLSQSAVSRRVVLVVTGKGPAEVVPATLELQAAVVGLPLTLTSQQGTAEALMATLFPYRYHLASAQPEKDLPSAVSEAGLDAAAIVKCAIGALGASVRVKAERA